MTVLEYLKITFNPLYPYLIRRPIICKNGLRLSVQGGTSVHYCRPRDHINQYEEVEIGFPSRCVKELLEYADELDNPLGTVYGYVPIDLVEKIVKDNGGIDIKAMTRS